ncbi:hypothetical protein ABK040_012599 [Willaertia magna]
MKNVIICILIICLLYQILTNIPLVQGEVLNKIIISKCDDISEWSGNVILDTTNIPSELSTNNNTLNSNTKVNGTLKWDFSKSVEISLRKPKDLTYWDFSQRESIQFYLKVNDPSPTNTALLYLSSDNTTTSGLDYYALYITLDFSGWKKFTLTKKYFSIVRNPLGWDKIDRIAFSSSWGFPANTSLILNIGEISLLNVRGPVYSDEDVFRALDLTLPNLEKVNSYFNDYKDLSNAKLEFCNYLRNVKNISWYFNSKENNDIFSLTNLQTILQRATDVLVGKYTIVNIPYQFTNPLNVSWNFNPTAQSNYNGAYDPEWTWQLNRFYHWYDLSIAYWYYQKNGQLDICNKILQLFSTQLNDWIVSQPLPFVASNGEYSSWRTIEVGTRLSNTWVNTFQRFLTVMSCNDMFTMVKSFLEQANYLYQFNTVANWLTIELDGIYVVSSLFYEFKEAKRWRDFASETLYKEQTEQFQPDGPQFELSTGYHQVSVSNIIGVYLNAKTVGRVNELRVDYINSLERALMFNALMMTPSGYLPKINDAGIINVVTALKDYAPYFDNELINWIVKGRPQGSSYTPNFTSYFFPNTGFVVMRQNWTRSSHYAFMDIAPLGYSHEHQDKLNIIIEPYGRQNLLYDGGGGNYEVSDFRKYAIGTESHNTILIDNLPQYRINKQVTDMVGYGDKNTPKPIFINSTIFDYAKGVYMDSYGNKNYKPAIHQREFIFIKETDKYRGFYIAIDTLQSRDGNFHNYEARWHLNTVNINTNYKINNNNNNYRIVTTNDKDVPNLAVISLTQNVVSNITIGQTTPFILGWNVIGPQSANYPTASITHKVRDRNVTLVTCFIPLLPNEYSEELITNIIEAERNVKYRMIMNNGNEIEITKNSEKDILNNENNNSKYLRIVMKRSNGDILLDIAPLGNNPTNVVTSTSYRNPIISQFMSGSRTNNSNNFTTINYWNSFN